MKGPHDAAIARIRGGGLRRHLARESEGAAYGWFWQLKMPDAPSRAIHTVLASHDFQEGLKNYRDLAFLDRTLGRWADNFDAYRSMVGTRGRVRRPPAPADAVLASNSGEALVAQRNGIEAHRCRGCGCDVAALGNAERATSGTASGASRIPGRGARRRCDGGLKNRLRLVKGRCSGGWRPTTAAA
jgi:hypothetical protein